MCCWGEVAGVGWGATGDGEDGGDRVARGALTADATVPSQFLGDSVIVPLVDS